MTTPVTSPSGLNGDPSVYMVERAVRDPSIDLERIKELVQLREEIAEKERHTAFARSMAQAQHAMRPVATDSANPQTRSRYASYAALDRALRPVYTEHGFSLTFNTESLTPELVRVLCTVMHSSGHEKIYMLDMPSDGKGARGGDVMTRTHATGSAVSYGMRYLLRMIFNIAIGEADDDGNAAGGGGAISDEQVAEIKSLIEATGSDEGKFLRYLKVNDLASLKVSQYPRAIMALKAKAGGPNAE